MIKFNKIFTTIGLSLAIASCAKEEISTSQNDAMQFWIKEITQSRVAYDDQENGGISATFEAGDDIGLYAFYNNFYYFYDQYNNFAESIIFANQGLRVDTQGAATYSPLRSWTFSTIYGTAPHTIDCIAYYPFKEGYNPNYVVMNHDSNGAATLAYQYVDGDTVNSNIDFMTAHTRYDDSATPEKFRSDMLGLGSIPFIFTRRTASLNLRVSKPEGYATDVIVTGVTLYFDAYTKFTHTVNGESAVQWEGMTTGYALQASAACEKSLAETSWNPSPESGAMQPAENLLSEKERFFLPPDTNIHKVLFTITVNEVEKSYTWHPHIAPIKANSHYTLNLELDPNRAN